MGVAGAQPMAQPLPPVVLVGRAWVGVHVGRAHAFLAPRPPLLLAGQPEGPHHSQHLVKWQELRRVALLEPSQWPNPCHPSRM